MAFITPFLSVFNPVYGNLTAFGATEYLASPDFRVATGIVAFSFVAAIIGSWEFHGKFSASPAFHIHKYLPLIIYLNPRCSNVRFGSQAAIRLVEYRTNSCIS